MNRVLSRTESVCPACLERIPAFRTAHEDGIYLEKECPAHGKFQTRIWGNQVPYDSWSHEKPPLSPGFDMTPVRQGCPYDCGLCGQHKQYTCCVLLEVTRRCNLSCPVCFASAGDQINSVKDISLTEINDFFLKLMEAGGPFNIQLSGGEPTMRNDLAEIIRLGKTAGFTFFQLNTNGIRLAKEPDYAKGLAEAGLSCVFLQFDGLDDSIYQTLRGQALWDIKQKAIAACKEAGLGVVLVPTLVPGVNTNVIGAIISYAASWMPVVRGVHFQPVSYFGRFQLDITAGLHSDDRFTLSDLLWEIESQTDGLMKWKDFSPGHAENAYCSFSGNFILEPNGTLKSIGSEAGCGCGSNMTGQVNGGSMTGQASKKSRDFVARQWSGHKLRTTRKNHKDAFFIKEGTDSLDDFLEVLDNKMLAISAMAFMDAWNLDLERLQECYIHVISGSENSFSLIPFCAFNLTSDSGEALYRNGN